MIAEVQRWPGAEALADAKDGEMLGPPGMHAQLQCS